MINATSNTNAMTNANAAGCFITPIRSADSSGFETYIRLLMYDTDRNEIGYSDSIDVSSKTFIIDHPIDNDKYLVHACLEGPEGGVYYRGTSEITNNKYVEIELPHYVSCLANDFTIIITPICNTPICNTPICNTPICNTPICNTPICNTPICNNYKENMNTFKNEIVRLGTTQVIDNKFIVYGKNTEFNWLVQGKRCNIKVEPLKNETKVYGSGPYKWV